MPNKIRFCIICKRYDRKIRSAYTRIYTNERATKLLEGYRRRYNGQELSQPILNEYAHKKCYNKIVQGVSSAEFNDMLISNEPKQDDNDDEQDQTALIKFRSRMPLPSNVNKQLLERRQRVCVVCNRYGYRTHNKMKQIISNFMANKLAEGFAYIYKRPYEKSLLDAHIHQSCFRKLYSSYRYHAKKKNSKENPLSYKEHSVRVLPYLPHETRSRMNFNKAMSPSSESVLNDPNDEMTTQLSIEQLLSTPLHTSVATTNPNIELSARSCLFRPCVQRLSPEEFEFYTKRNATLITIRTATDQSSIVHSSIVHDDHNHDIEIIDYDQSPDWTPQQTSQILLNKKMCATTLAAKIRRRYLKPPPLAKPTNPLVSDHAYITDFPLVQQIPVEVEQLYSWLITELKLSGNPLSMGDVLIKYKELKNDTETSTTRESIHRERIRHYLEKYYSNQFIFVTPNKREGTYVALNDAEYYVRWAIKNAKQEKEKITASSLAAPATVVIQSTPIDHQRQTCETVMNAMRKIRLYIRDPKQLDTVPPLLLQNTVGLMTASEKRFNKISSQYDFYRMIDEDLFDNETTNKTSNKPNKYLRNVSLASDLISARHDNRVSQKHFSLAEEFTKANFHCTPKQIITLLNRHGHTCSYKSYMRMKALRQRTTNSLSQENVEIENIIHDDDRSSDSEMDLPQF